MPVLIPYFLSLGLSMHEIFQIQAIYGLVAVLFEIPTGYLCDFWGRKKSLLLGALFAGAGFTSLIWADNFWKLAFYEAVLGISASLISGADISLLYDSTQGQSRKEASRALAGLQFSLLLGESIASLLGGYLVTFSFQHVVYANAVVSWIPLLVAFFVNEPPYERMNRKTHVKNFQEVFRHVFLNPDKILIFSFVNLILWSLSGFIAVWVFQKYWVENGISLGSFGILWASYNITAAVVGAYVHNLEHRFGPVPLLILIGAAPVFGYLGMGLSGGVIGVSFGFLFYVGRGLNSVLLRDALNWRTPSAYRATVNSLQSFFFRVGFAIVGPGVGYLADQYGIKITLVGLGVCFAILMFVTLLPMVILVRTKKYIPES